MELYGSKSHSLPQKTVIVLAELALVGLAHRVLFGDLWVGLRAFGEAPEPTRNLALFACDLVVVARFLITLFVFLQRTIPLEEAFSVPMAFALYLLGFPLLARGNASPWGGLEVLGLVLFCLGSCLNTVSEWQRRTFKRRPTSAGRLFTGGLFSLSMHVNYFGDLLWVLGFACITHNAYAVLVPAFLLCFFWYFNIPKLDAYLRGRYGQQFFAYEKNVKRLVPFVL